MIFFRYDCDHSLKQIIVFQGLHFAYRSIDSMFSYFNFSRWWLKILIKPYCTGRGWSWQKRRYSTGGSKFMSTNRNVLCKFQWIIPTKVLEVDKARRIIGKILRNDIRANGVSKEAIENARDKLLKRTNIFHNKANK